MTSFLQSAGVAVLIGLLLGTSTAAKTDAGYPLRPPDTSSPRATLRGFITDADDLYRDMRAVLEDYAASDRLYLTADESQRQYTVRREAQTLLSYFDLSRIPPVLFESVAFERVLQLKEVLDRIEIPTFADIPDQDATTGQPVKRWRLPNTEIDIGRVDSGRDAGKYLVSADTVERLPEFYARVSESPYKPGAGLQLVAVYRTMSGIGSRGTIYEAYVSSPIGLSHIVPPRWMLNLPDWAKLRYAGATPWQWLGLTVALLICALIIWLVHRAARQHAESAKPHWHVLLLPVALIFVAGLLAPVFDAVLRIGGNPRIAIEYTRIGALYIGAAWLAIVLAAELGEAIVGSRRLTSLDDQLIRLGVRLVGVMAAGAILIQGGDELGLPAYSVLAGLGVGGVAVALAAQSTIANLIGSMLIALEKPFRVGQLVRIGATEGTIEDVGFRSTRIRTPDSSLVSIPSSTVVGSTVENLSVRARRRQRFVVQVTYDTSREKLEKLIEGIRQLLAENPWVEPETYQVRFNNFGESSLDILVIFYLLVTDYPTELAERETVLLNIMDLTTDEEVAFAFPTRTLYVERTPEPGTSRPDAEGTG
jgi:MscS family membrane protein